MRGKKYHLKEALPATHGFTAMIIIIVLLFSGFGDLEYIYDVYFRAPRGNRCDARHGLNEIHKNIGDDYFRSLLMGLLGTLIGLALGAIPTWYLNINGIELSDGIREGMEGCTPCLRPCASLI